MSELTSEIWIEGLAFPESPRWQDDRFWFVDMHRGELLFAEPSTEESRSQARKLLNWDTPIGGLGWLPEGDLLFVDKHQQKIMRWGANDSLPDLHADLSHWASSHCNDMFTSPDGTSYVGTYGFDPVAGESFQKGELIKVTSGGEVTLAAAGLSFPNGIALGDNGKRLVVAETVAARVVEYQVVGEEQLLSDRRTLVRLPGQTPDGLCLDVDGNVWVAPLASRELLKIDRRGEVVERVATRGYPVACTLGDEQNPTLFITSVRKPLEEFSREDYVTPGNGFVESVALPHGSYV